MLTPKDTLAEKWRGFYPAKGGQKQQAEGEILELSLKEHFYHCYPQSIRKSPTMCKGTALCACPYMWSICVCGVSATGRWCCKPRDHQHKTESMQEQENWYKTERRLGKGSWKRSIGKRTKRPYHTWKRSLDFLRNKGSPKWTWQHLHSKLPLKYRRKGWVASQVE